ncbi:MAG TPA: PilN domain-containing protein [Gaiellaceae bacterium]|nr:PilN domain-containing protein [Gaiellaceae bacterium]
MGIDLKKEIKLSDLLRRKAKGEDAPVRKEPKDAASARRLFARGPKERREANEPRKPKKAAAERSAPALPEIPLMRAFSLLPREEARETRGRPAMAQVLVALLGLVVVAGLGSGYLFFNAQVADKQAEKDDLRVQLADLDVPSEEPEADGGAELATEVEARTAALAAALSARVTWDRVLREVSLVVPDDVWVEQITAGSGAAATGGTTAPAAPEAAEAGGTALMVRGGAESQTAVARYLARLAVIPELTGVQLQVSERQVQDTGATYSYTILATVAAGGATS